MSPGERRGGPGQETASLEIADTASVTPGLAAEPKMSVRERDELKTLVNERARLEIDRVKSLAAERLLDLNRQLEAQWEAEDFAVGELMKALEVMAAAANAKVKARCDELGILPELSPRVVTGFGRCGVSQTRRALLRQLVKDENEAALRKAVHRINTWKFETRTEPVRDGLTSNAASTFLNALPATTELLPVVDIGGLTRALYAKSADL